MRPTTPLLLMLSACPSTGKTPIDSDPPVDTGPEIERAESWGEAPWDPLWLLFEEGPQHAPLVHDADGEVAPVEPLAYRDQTLAYRATGEFEAGDYAIVGWDDTDAGWTDYTFTVRPYGRDAAFSADAVLGKVYELDAETLMTPVPELFGYAGAAMILDSERVYLRVAAPEEGEAGKVDLEVVAEVIETGARCLLLKDSASLSETGELSWSMDDLTVSTESGEVQAWDLALRLGFLADGSAAAGLEARGTVDTRNLSAWVMDDDDPLSLCEYMESAGSDPCAACASDSVVACADLQTYAGALTPVDVTLEDELPMCGLNLKEDLGGELPAFSCDVPEIELDCGCHAPLTRGAALPFSIGLLAFLGRRRRPR